MVYVSVSVPIVATELAVTAVAPDLKCQLLVNGGPPTEQVALNIGDTLVEVLVGSIDGSVTKVCIFDNNNILTIM